MVLFISDAIDCVLCLPLCVSLCFFSGCCSWICSWPHRRGAAFYSDRLQQTRSGEQEIGGGGENPEQTRIARAMTLAHLVQKGAFTIVDAPLESGTSSSESSSKADTCPVCLEDSQEIMERNDVWIRTRCGHRFCSKCALRYVQGKAMTCVNSENGRRHYENQDETFFKACKCPMCNKPLFSVKELPPLVMMPLSR